MIQFRVGKNWRRETGTGPQDAFGLWVDGVNLTPQALNESLEEVIAQLVTGVANLHLGKVRLAEVDLSDSYQKLVFRLLNDEVEISLVKLSEPLAPIRSLKVATQHLTRAARGLAERFFEGAPRPERTSEIGIALKNLDKRPRHSEEIKRFDYSYNQSPAREGERGPFFFGFQLFDETNRLQEPSSALGSLLCPGAVQLVGPSEGFQSEWHCPPFLLAWAACRESLRWLTDRQRGIPSLSQATPSEPLALAIFELGESVAFACARAEPRQQKNPYLLQLIQRCLEGRAALRPPLPVLSPGPDLDSSRAKKSRPPRISWVGKLSRLPYQRLWETGEFGPTFELLEPTRSGGVLAMSRHAQRAYSKIGKTIWNRPARGRLVSGDPALLPRVTLDCEPQRLTAYRGMEPTASWTRDSNVKNVQSFVNPEGDSWLLFSRDVVWGIGSATGQVRWRFPVAQLQATLLRSLLWLTTRQGSIICLDPKTGSPHYRLEFEDPVKGQLLSWLGKLIGVFAQNRSAQVTLKQMDPSTGKVEWSRDIDLQFVSDPLPMGDFLFVAGERGDGECALIKINRAGKQVWSRALTHRLGPFHLLPLDEGSVMVTGPEGTATAYFGNGKLRWRVGGEDLGASHKVLPQKKGRLIYLPGKYLRVVESASGSVVGHAAAADVRAYCVGTRFKVFTAAGDGRVSCFAPIGPWTVA